MAQVPSKKDVTMLLYVPKDSFRLMAIQLRLSSKSGRRKRQRIIRFVSCKSFPNELVCSEPQVSASQDQSFPTSEQRKLLFFTFIILPK